MLKHCLYRSYTKGLKIAAHVLPLPRPTLFSGSGAVSELLEAISDLGFRRLLLVTDEGLVRIDMVGKVLEQTQGLGLQVGVFSEVKPDPTYDQVEDGLRAYNASQSEAILALGGGSAIDCAKVIAARVSNKRSIKKLSGLFKVWRTPAPLFVIPTTSGTGSEVTIAAVVSDPNTHLKTPLMDPKLVPIMAALDPDLLIGLPAKITADTGIDALTHAVEAYISRNATPETQAYSVAAIKLIFRYLPKASRNGCGTVIFSAKRYRVILAKHAYRTGTYCCGDSSDFHIVWFPRQYSCNRKLPRWRYVIFAQSGYCWFDDSFSYLHFLANRYLRRSKPRCAY